MTSPGARDFETQHKLLLLETLYDAGLSLGSLPDEEALAEDVLGRAVGVLDASRGYLATFGEGEVRRAEARVGFPRRLSEAAVAEDSFLRDVLRGETALRRESGCFALRSRRLSESRSEAARALWECSSWRTRSAAAAECHSSRRTSGSWRRLPDFAGWPSRIGATWRS